MFLQIKKMIMTLIIMVMREKLKVRNDEEMSKSRKQKNKTVVKVRRKLHNFISGKKNIYTYIS